MEVPVGQRIYLDVTSTSVTNVMTGIPRVVRNLAQAQTEFDVILVEYDGISNQYFSVESFPTDIQSQKSGFLVKIGLRTFKNLGEIPLISDLMARVLRNRIVFYVFRRIFGSTSQSQRSKIVIESGILFLPEVPLNRGHSEKIKSIVTPGDVNLALFVHDLLPLSHPEYFSKDLVWKFHNYLELFDLASEVFVSNDDVANELQQKFQPKSLHTVALPTHFAPTLHAEFSPTTFLAVGTIEPRKNLNSILSAFKKYSEKNANAKLIVIGNPGWRFKPIVKLLQQMQREGLDITWLKNVSDEELLHYYRTSAALLFPSFYEGYGLPVIEALSQGTPVITSDRPVLRKFTKYGGVVLINPNSESEILQAMQTITDVRNRSHLQSQIRSDLIPNSWQKFSNDIFAHLHERHGS